MKAPFKVVKDKSGNRGIYNGVALVEFQKECESDKEQDEKCAWWNSVWDYGFSCGEKAR